MILFLLLKKIENDKKWESNQRFAPALFWHCPRFSFDALVKFLLMSCRSWLLLLLCWCCSCCSSFRGGKRNLEGVQKVCSPHRLVTKANITFHKTQKSVPLSMCHQLNLEKQIRSQIMSGAFIWRCARIEQVNGILCHFLSIFELMIVLCSL